MICVGEREEGPWLVKQCGQSSGNRRRVGRAENEITVLAALPAPLCVPLGMEAFQTPVKDTQKDRGSWTWEANR